jgi:hypothetical protein
MKLFGHCGLCGKPIEYREKNPPPEGYEFFVLCDRCKGPRERRPFKLRDLFPSEGDGAGMDATGRALAMELGP